MKMQNKLQQPSKKEIADFCQRNRIRKLSLFGSALREDFRPDSAVDVLVEFEAGHVPGFFRLVDLQEELSAIFGRKVDLRTPEDLVHSGQPILKSPGTRWLGCGTA